MKGLAKTIRAPVSIARLAADRWLWPWWSRLQGMSCEGSMTLFGCPKIRMAPGGRIVLGRDVKLFSRPGSNPLYLQSPCVFYLLKPNACIEIGAGSALSGTILCAAQSIQIGERVFIGADCRLMDTDFHPLSIRERHKHPTDGALTGPVTIGNDVFIGASALILKNTTLEEGCVVGAGAVVAGHYPPHSVVAGNPARVIRQMASAGPGQ